MNILISSPTPPSPGGTGTWTNPNLPGGCVNTPNILNPNSVSTSVDNMLCDGLYEFQYCVTNEGCDPVCSSVFVTLYPSPECNAGPDLGICGSFTFNLAAYTPKAGTTGTWALASGPSSAVFVNANDPTTSVTVTVVGTYVFQWQIVPDDPSSTCTYCIDYATVTISQQADATIIVTPEICETFPCPSRCVAAINENRPAGNLLDAIILEYPGTDKINFQNIDCGAGNGLLIGGWFKPECPLTQNLFEQELFSRTGPTGQYGKITVLNNGAVRLTENNLSDPVWMLTTPPNVVICGQWNQIYLKVDFSNGQIDMFVNGMLVQSAIAPPFLGTIQTVPSTIYFGGTFPSSRFRGRIANVVHSFNLISAQTIADDWAGGCPKLQADSVILSVSTNLGSTLENLCSTGNIDMTDCGVPVPGSPLILGNPPPVYYAQDQCCPN